MVHCVSYLRFIWLSQATEDILSIHLGISLHMAWHESSFISCGCPNGHFTIYWKGYSPSVSFPVYLCHISNVSICLFLNSIFFAIFFLLCGNPIQFKSTVLFKVLITDNKSYPHLFISKSTRSFFLAFCIFIYMLEFSIPLHTHTQIPARILTKTSSST